MPARCGCSNPSLLHAEPIHAAKPAFCCGNQPHAKSEPNPCAAREIVEIIGQPNVRDCDQVLPTLRFGVNPAHTKSSSDTNGHTKFRRAALPCGHDNDTKSELTSGLTTPLPRKSRPGG
jgi:hypothetical protein